MAVTVIKDNTTEDKVSKGSAFYAKDGVLTVTMWDGSSDQPLAVYAPGAWRSAKVDE